MDPLTAIGLVGNIITFVDIGMKLVAKAKGIYNSASGSSSENENIEIMANRFSTTVSDMQSRLPTGNMSKEETELKRLAGECIGASYEMQDFLNELRARKPNSQLSSLKAAWHDWRRKSEKEALHRKLDNLRQQLDLLLTSTLRFQCVERLNEIMRYGQSNEAEMASLGREMKLLRTSIHVKFLSSSALDQIKEVLSLSDSAILKVRQSRILAALRFDLMNERYDEVETAHYTTFNWLLDPLENMNKDVTERSNVAFTKRSDDDQETDLDWDTDSDESISSEIIGGWHDCNEVSNVVKTKIVSNHNDLNEDDLLRLCGPSYHSDEEYYASTESGPSRLLLSPDLSTAHTNFTHWLEKGNKIFHISGKPGSGKSTLMKYLCRHEELERHLNVWAGDKSLVFGKFFFWKPGTALQKKLRGLVRGLLYCILSEAPALIPLAFPKQWDATLSQPEIKFESSDDYFRAFSNLTASDEIYLKHKFVFFIDGLDEFEGDHPTLIKLFLDWASSRPSEVKFCVSSREWPIFSEAFKGCPNLRLHELTRRDIMRLVEDRLDNIAAYHILGNDYERQLFESDVVAKSDGVFLWVKLMLRDIEESIYNGDRLSQLKKRVEATPTELNDLFWHLFNSIHKCDQKEALLMLVVTRHCPHDWPLYRLSFLEDYLENRDFACGRNFGQDNISKVLQRLRTTRKRVMGKCKGLIDIQSTDFKFLQHRRRTRPKWITFRDTVKLTHRSIVEFLDSSEITDKISAQLPGLDPIDILCQTLIAHIRHTNLSAAYFSNLMGPRFKQKCIDGLIAVFAPPNLEYEICNVMHVYRTTRATLTNPTRFSDCLDRIVSTVGDRQSKQNFEIRTFIYQMHKRGFANILKTVEASLSTRVVLYAALNGITEYIFQGGSERIAEVQLHIPFRVLLHALVSSNRLPSEGGQMRHLHIRRFGSLLRSFLENGTSANEESWAMLINCFHFTLVSELSERNARSRWRLPIVALFLFYGANPRFWIRLLPDDDISEDGSYEHDIYDDSEEDLGMSRVRLEFWNDRRSCDLPQCKIDWGPNYHPSPSQTEISCPEVIGLLFPQYKEVLCEVVNWIIQHEQEYLSHEEIRELQNLFGPVLKPLFEGEESWNLAGRSDTVAFPVLSAGRGQLFWNLAFGCEGERLN